jgi:hypothetical protein
LVTVIAAGGYENTNMEQRLVLGWTGEAKSLLDKNRCDIDAATPTGLLEIPHDGHNCKAVAVGMVEIPCGSDILFIYIRPLARIALRAPESLNAGDRRFVSFHGFDDNDHELALGASAVIEWHVSGAVVEAPAKSHDWLGELMRGSLSPGTEIMGAFTGEGVVTATLSGLLHFPPLTTSTRLKVNDVNVKATND